MQEKLSEKKYKVIKNSMNYKYLLYSFLFALVTFAFYKFNKWWLNERKQNSQLYYKPFTYLDTIRHWFIITGFGIASLVYFLKALGCL